MNEIIKRKSSQDPWEISFSFGRALQEDAMKLWSAKMENVKEAQEVFTKTLELAGRARRGEL